LWLRQRSATSTGVAEIEVGHRAGRHQMPADGESENTPHVAQQIIRRRRSLLGYARQQASRHRRRNVGGHGTAKFGKHVFVQISPRHRRVLEVSAFDLGFVPVLGQLLELAASLPCGASFELRLDLAQLLQQRVTACIDEGAFGARGLRAAASSMSG
jgi:hypothetical protein